MTQQLRDRWSNPLAGLALRRAGEGRGLAVLVVVGALLSTDTLAPRP
jgi:hypothetical protein